MKFNPLQRPLTAIAPFMAAFILLVTACGKPVPVKEMAEGRAEIEEAQRVNAEEFSADKYSSARTALLEAHKALADEDVETTAIKAMEARKLGLEAREESSPKYGAREKSNTEVALKDADEAYAEVLAKDDYQAAMKLYQDGSDILKTSDEENKGSGGIDERHATLRKYQSSFRKFEASREAAQRAKNVALAQKDDLLDSLAGVETMLKRAEQYNAKEISPDLYKSAEDEIAAAKSSIEEGKLKKGNTHILRSEELAQAVLSSSASKYAQKRLEEAKVAVDAGNTEFARYVPSKPTKDAELNKKIEGLRETRDAAGEALKSAEGNYGSQKYEDSISDSDEAIRLANILKERIAGMRTELARVTGRGGIDPNKTVDNRTGGKDWKRYVVRKRKPADCLWRIAGQSSHYGNPRLWKKIYSANKSIIKNPDLIYPGQVLKIPPRNWKPGDPVGEEKVEEVTEEEKPGDDTENTEPGETEDTKPGEETDTEETKPGEEKKEMTEEEKKDEVEKKDDTQPRENIEN